MTRDRRPRERWSREDWLIFAAIVVPPALLWLAFLIFLCTGFGETVR